MKDVTPVVDGRRGTTWPGSPRTPASRCGTATTRTCGASATGTGRRTSGGTPGGEVYYLGLLPRVVAETDPTRPYWAGSPWSGSWAHHPNDPGHGATHSWEVWNRRDYREYLDDVPRFVAEFGWPAHADRLLTVQERPQGLAAVVVNQGAQKWTGTAVLRRIAVDGTVLAQARQPFTAAARSVVDLPVPPDLRPVAGADKEFLTVAADGLRAHWFAVPDKDFACPAPRWDIEVAADGDTAEVTVSARTLLRDLLLQADLLGPEAAADRGLVTLLPGESVTVTVRGWDRPGPEAAAAALFTVNAAVARPRLHTAG